MRILLLNPPADRLVLRDYYCSTISKANYIWHPIDLLAQSGWLSRDHEVVVLDAVAERLADVEARGRIERANPDVVFALVSAATWTEDLRLLDGLKQKLGFKLVLSGEIFLDNPADIMENQLFIDAALLDFTSRDLQVMVGAGFKPAPTDIFNMAWRTGKGIEVRREKASDTFAMPVPRHELFPMERYRMPWQRQHPFATVMTDFGCPFGCLFCNSRAVGYATRNIENLREELDAIAAAGIRQLFIKDMTFGAVRRHALEVLNLMIHNNYGFTWNAYTRSDLLDEELVELMARAGCHLLQIGVESADERLLEQYGKGVNVEQTRRAFRILKKRGIDAGAHFILGLPGDTLEGMRKTVRLAMELDPVYASFNLAMPRLGASMESNGWQNLPLNSSGDRPFYRLDGVSPGDIVEERRRAIRRFYLRPKYWLRAARSLRTPYQLWDALKQASAILQEGVRR